MSMIRTLDENGNMVERPIPPEWTDTTRPATGSEHLDMIRAAFDWMDTLRGWDIPTHTEYERLRDRALPAAEALAEEAAHSHIILCPCCDGMGGSSVDSLHALEPASVSACYVCHGLHHIDTVRFTRAMLTEGGDVFAAARMAACDAHGVNDYD